MAKRRRKTDAGTPPETKDRIRTAADERAVKAGCRFDPERAAFACGWMEEYLHLYEGDQAGRPLTLLPCWREFFEHLYGWVRWSDEWGEWVRRFTHASFWGAKKNGKSPMAAAHNLYLLCGDNEPGQKVYQAAANGEQARIAQMHAVQMVRQSPQLEGDCKVNNQTLLIAHRPTNSQLMILTGDDSRGAKSKEGLNGSVTYDEMHVVNREMEERTSRAGISRKEPLNVSFSTAGDDPSSVGFQRAKYGRQVNAGERHDVHFLHVEYSAPAKATEADIDERLEEFGKEANPAWGRLIKPTEFRADWERSKGNPREVARFKQYRLNLWVGSTNQWLDSAGWERGGREYTLADLAGRECYAALDLSRTRDMSAFVLIFPAEDGTEAVDVWPMFWLPEQTARERDHLFPLLSWGADGHVKLTTGGVVDYAVVKADIRAAVREHGLVLRRWYFDQKYAEEITQQLADGETMGGETEPGIGGERHPFPQTITEMTGPAKEVERRVSAGLVGHPGNAVMTWQVGHCEAKTDVNQNVRPVKPNPHSGKSVDGVVCLVMGFNDLLTAPPSEPTLSML
jgi:phage terminase large subunit-like protein